MNRLQLYIKEKRNRHRRRMTVKENLKIYQNCVKSCANMETSAVRRYEEEKFFHFFALLLQIVSFFTTYAGVAMYFGNIFDLAPLFIALTIQGVLYLTAISAFQPGRKNRRKRWALIICTLISVAFSYTGLVTLANSPQVDYKRAYESYVDTFRALKDEVASQNLEVDTLAADISNEYLKSINTLQALDRYISQLTEEAEAEINIPSTNKSSTTTTMPDGTVVRGYETTANPEYAAAVEARQQASAKALEVKLVRDDLYQEVLDAVGATEGATGEDGTAENAQSKESAQAPGGEETGDIESNDIESIGSYANIRSAVQWEKIAERINNMQSGKVNEDGAENAAEALQNFRQEYFRVANKNNSAVSTVIQGTETSIDMALYSMDSTLLDSGLEQLSIYQEMKEITIADWDTIAAATFTEEKKGVAGVIDRFGQMIGADMYNSDMKELMVCYQQLKEAVVENFSQVTSSLPDAESYVRYQELAAEKQNVLELPEILVFAFERFGDPEYAGSAICCLILALLNDFSTVLLGWLGTKRAYAIPETPSGKIHYDDSSELFPMVFTALQSQFVMQIRTGQFLTMSREEFTEGCYQYVNGIIHMIQQFVAGFTLSPCTAQMGYNLIWRYEKEEEVAPYMPLISLLLKCGLLKVLPISQYEYLEMEYYLGKTDHLWVEEVEEKEDRKSLKAQLEEVKAKGHVLLLRNRTESYLRENLSDRIMMEDNHE